MIGLVMGHTMGCNMKRSEFRDPILHEIATTAMESSEQTRNIDSFRHNRIRLLVATDVVEEGMDIPLCSLVCCFDPIKNVKSFVQMQGRARDLLSRFMILSNDKTATKLQIKEFKNLVDTSKKLALYAKEGIAKDPEAYKSFILPKDSYIEIPDTKAKLCKYNAKIFLDKYCQSLPSDEFCRPFVEYSYEEVKGGIIAIATLPPMVPKTIRCLHGKTPSKTKEIAENEVAYEVIQKLIKMKKLNRYLLSTSKYGTDSLMGKFSGDVKNVPIHKYIGTPLLNEVLTLSNEYYLYELVLDPKYPYLNQTNSLGALFFRDDLVTSNVDIVLNNQIALEAMKAINTRRQEAYCNAIGNTGKYYAEKIRNMQVTASLSKPRKIEVKEYWKFRFFHYYAIYSTHNADYKFFQRVCSGKDLFAVKLFYEDLIELKKHLTPEDSAFVLSKVNEHKELIHLCIIPLIKENGVSVIDYEVIDKAINYIKYLLKTVYQGKFRLHPEFYAHKNKTSSQVNTFENTQLLKEATSDNNVVEEENNSIKVTSAEELIGREITTFYNKAKYIILGKSPNDLKSIILWKDKKRRKAWRVKYWSYYKIRYGISLNIQGQMLLAKPIDPITDKRILHTSNCYQNFVFEECRSSKEQKAYLDKLRSQYTKDCSNKIIELPLEVCEVYPIPYELIEIIKTTHIIFSSFNNVTMFKEFLIDFFSKILIDPKCSNKLEDSSGLMIPMSEKLQLNLLAEALTSGSANEGYNYQRLEFLGDSVLRIIEAWDAFTGNPEADIGELRVNKNIKLGNKWLTQIGYKLGFNKLIRVSPSKGAFAGYIPPGFQESYEYIEIFDTKKNIAINTTAFNLASFHNTFISKELNWSTHAKPQTTLKDTIDNKGEATSIVMSTKKIDNDIITNKDELDVNKDNNEDGLDYVDGVSKFVKDILFEKEPKSPKKEYEELDTEPIHNQEEIPTHKPKPIPISDKMIADAIESVTAAISLSCGLSGAKQWLKHIGLLEFKSRVLKEDTLLTKDIDFSELQSKLKYTFKNPRLLLQAFTHASYLTTNPNDLYWVRNSKLESSDTYQKFEYLGEGVCDYLISKYLYTTYPHANPCLLHKLKICCLNNQLFCVIAVDLELDKFLRSCSIGLQQELKQYKNCLKSLRNSPFNYDTHIDLDGLDHCFVKVLSDLLEAVIGVIFYETKDFDEVERIFLPILIPYFNIYATPQTFKEHPKCFLYEMIAKEKGQLRNIRWWKSDRMNKKGFFETNYRGWLGDILIAEENFRYDNCIVEKRFFKKMFENVEAVIKEYHRRKNNGYGEYYY